MVELFCGILGGAAFGKVICSPLQSQQKLPLNCRTFANGVRRMSTLTWSASTIKTAFILKRFSGAVLCGARSGVFRARIRQPTPSIYGRNALLDAGEPSNLTLCCA